MQKWNCKKSFSNFDDTSNENSDTTSAKSVLTPSGDSRRGLYIMGSESLFHNQIKPPDSNAQAGSDDVWGKRGSWGWGKFEILLLFEF